MSAARMREMPAVSTEAKSIFAPLGNGSKDRQLVRGIGAFDIEGGIGFGKAPGLRLGEDIGKIGPVSSMVERMKLQVPLRMP